MNGRERSILWNLYPEVRELFERYNDIFLEDDQAWKEVDSQVRIIWEKYQGSKVVEILLLDAVYQLEKIARKR